MQKDDDCSWNDGRARLFVASCLPPRAPAHVVALQGTTARGDLWVHVTWDRNDPRAVGYEVIRDGRLLGRVEVDHRGWDDLAFRDQTVSGGSRHRYRVRARYADGTSSAPSAVSRAEIRTDPSIGSGRTFRVDQFPGSDIERARAAVAAATAVGGGVIEFGARTYVLDEELHITGDNLVLRGAGRTKTTIQPGFPGAAAGCDPAPALIRFSGGHEDLSGTGLAEAAPRGAQAIQMRSTGDVRAGDVLVIDESTSGTPQEQEAAGVMQDPGTGADQRWAYETNRVVRVQGDEIYLSDPIEFEFTTAATVRRIGRGGMGGGVERMTLQGPGPQERRHYRLLALEYVADFHAADVTARWANRHLVQATGYNLSFVGFHGPDGGADSFDGQPCKYRISVVRSANVAFVAGTMGDPAHDRNQSFLTFQKGERFLVRDSRFHGSRTYAVNEHGLGSPGLVIENNRLAVGPDARHGAVLLGNSTWGFAGPALIRNNLFVGNSRDLFLQENSYGTRFTDNVSIDNRHRVIDGYGWAGPDTDEPYWGSMRLTVLRNNVQRGRSDGIVLGGRRSELYPFAGVKDVVIAGNRLGVDGDAIRIGGSGGDTRRIQVFANSGSARYVHPEPGSEDHWSSGPDGRSSVPEPMPWVTSSLIWMGR